MLLTGGYRLHEFEELRSAIADSVPPNDEFATPNNQEEAFSEFQKFGFSLFVTSQKLRVMPTGTDGQISVVRQILDTGPSPVIAFAIHKIFEFSSGSTTTRQIHVSIETSDYPDDLKGFLLALLHPTPRLTPEQVIGALTYASHCPAIDQWMVLLRCCQSLYVLDLAHELAAIPDLARLLVETNSVETARLLSCVFKKEQNSRTIPSALELGLMSAFYRGVSSLEQENTVFKSVVSAIAAVGGFDRKEVVANLAGLDRTAAKLSGQRIASVVCAIASQLGGLTESRAIAGIRWLEITGHEILADATSTRSIFDAVYRNSLSGDESEHVQTAVIATRSGEWDSIVARSEQMGTSREAAALTIDALLHTSRLGQAIAHAADACVSFPSLLHRVPLDELLRGVPRSRPKSIEECLACAIILDLGVRHLSIEYSRRRNFAVEDTLRVAGVATPSLLLSRPLRSSAFPLLLHFLATICVPSVMDTIPIGNSSRALLEERVRILQGLLEQGYTNRAELESEIVQLSAEITVAAERASLDQQRIYVDTEGLAARLSESVHGDFELFRRLRMLDPRRVATADILRRVKEAFPDILLLDLGDLLSEMASEAASHLLRIVKVTRYEFALGEVHGLDGYLSGGIRHGNLEALLRQPFVSADILGSFDSRGAFILPKSFAENALPLDEEVRSTVQSALQRFAETFQEIVARVLNEWIQIRMEDKPEHAIFDFSVTTGDFIRLQAMIGDTQTVDECVAKCVDYWWSRVLANLEHARQRVRGQLREELERAIDDLAQTLDAIGGPFMHALVTNVVQPVRAKLEISLEALASWFEVGHSLDAGDIELPLMMAVAQSTMTNLHPRVTFEWQLTADCVGFMLRRRSLKHWVDILITLFHNVVQHSGQRDAVLVQVHLAATEQAVSICVSNPLGPSVGDGEIDRAISAIERQFADSAYLAAVRREGRSGLMKVLKAARVDLRAENSEIQISRVGRLFMVELHVPQSPSVRIY